MTRRIRSALATVAFAFGALSSTASATDIKTNNVKINAGKGDFGSGNHQGGWPVENASVVWDFTPNASGVLIARASVTGVLYLDTVLSGTVKLRIIYSSSQAGAAPLAVRIHTLTAGPALFGAQDPGHKLFIGANNEPPVSNSTLNKVSFTLLDEDDVPLAAPASLTFFTAPNLRLFTGVKIDNTPPMFQSGSVKFQRSNGDMQVTILGKLFWNSTSSAGTAGLFAQFKDINGVVLETTPVKVSTLAAAPNQNNVSITSTQNLVQGRLFKVRLVVGQMGFVLGTGQPIMTNAKEQNFDFLGGFNTGTFQLTPVDPVVGVGQHFTHAFTWTVPDPLNWHDLQALRLRILDGSDVVLSAYFDEATQTFALFDEATGKFSQAYPAGSNQSLQTPRATLYMKESGLQASGPTSPSVTLFLSLSCKPKLGGKWLAVEVAANDDQGNQGAFEFAGGITVF